MSKARLVALLPILLFSALALVLWAGLSRDPAVVPSVLINKPAPEFKLAAVANLNLPALSSDDLKLGKVTLLNIWASWCIPCRQEQPVLLELAKRSDIKLVGINNKDEPENARQFLATYGNPFSAIGSDINGRVTIDFGAYGVPETFIIDGKGVIRFKVIGGLTSEFLETELPKQLKLLAQD
jgi:cytochrome c biogenesis protein CcmG, thiol:disulfide interchange protein DsbE